MAVEQPTKITRPNQPSQDARVELARKAMQVATAAKALCVYFPREPCPRAHCAPTLFSFSLLRALLRD